MTRRGIVTSLAVLAFCAASSPGAIRIVSTGATYSTVQSAVTAAANGDVIEIDSDYTGSAVFASISKDLTIRGAGATRPVLDADFTCPNNQGLLILSGSSNVTVENLELRNCQGASNGNGCGIRIVGRNVTIRNCYIHDNEDGIMGNPSSSTGSSVLVEYCEFAHNGFGNVGYTHNIYVGPYETFTMRCSWSHNTYTGHEVKTRALNNYIVYNRIGNEDMNPEGTNASYEIDVPQAGLTYIMGNQVHQGLYTANSGIITYAEEGTINPDLHLYVVNNTIVNQRGSGAFIRNASATSAWVQNNVFQGTGTTISGPAISLNNWATNNAYLANVVAYDFRLTAASIGAIDAGGVPAPAPLPEFSLIPTCQYVHPCSYETRPASGLLDIGAYEYVVPNQPPTVNAGVDQDVYEGAAVSLHAAASDPNNDPLTYAWTQPTGLNVTLSGAATADASFTAPVVSTITQASMTFTVTVSDAKAAPVSDSVNVRVWMRGDVNRDNHVDTLDLLALAGAWGSISGNGSYNVVCDLNNDGTVDVIDLLIVADNWGRTLN